MFFFYRIFIRGGVVVETVLNCLFVFYGVAGFVEDVLGLVGEWERLSRFVLIVLRVKMRCRKSSYWGIFFSCLKILFLVRGVDV